MPKFMPSSAGRNQLQKLNYDINQDNNLPHPGCVVSGVLSTENVVGHREVVMEGFPGGVGGVTCGTGKASAAPAAFVQPMMLWVYWTRPAILGLWTLITLGIFVCLVLSLRPNVSGENCEIEDECTTCCKDRDRCEDVQMGKETVKHCKCQDGNLPRAIKFPEVQTSWVEAKNGEVPKGAVPAGSSKDKYRRFICRYYVPGEKAELCIGTLYPEKKACVVPHYTNAITSSTYEVFVGAKRNMVFTWHKFKAGQRLPQNAVSGAFSRFRRTDYMYIGRIKTKGEYVVGKFWARNWNLEF